MGTRIPGLQVTKVIDGDTIKVRLDDAEESLRLACVDTEESRPGGGKPVTEAGKAASAIKYFTQGGGMAAGIVSSMRNHASILDSRCGSITQPWPDPPE